MIPISEEEFSIIKTIQPLRALGMYEKEISEYLDSGAPAARLDDFGSDRMASVVRGYKTIIKRKHIPVSIITRKGAIYVVADDEISSPNQSDWIETLCERVIGEQYELPTDIEETANYVIDTFLNDREKQVLAYRYRDKASLKEIGESLNVSRERIRQLQNRAEKKLRENAKVREYLILGLDGVKKLEEERKAIIEKERTERLASLAEAREKLLRQITVVSRYNPDTKSLEEIKGVPIDVLGLSVRAYNIIRREGDIHTVETLLNLREHIGRKGLFMWCMRLKNCGKKTAQEITQATDKYCEEEERD